jgi:predicted glycosyltransferase
MKSIIELAEEKTVATTPEAQPSAVQKKIWIDMDNSPHVPFFAPIIPELKARGFKVFLTARDSYQVVELLKYYKIPARIIGRHHGKLKIWKILGTIWRALSLAYVVRKEKVDVALSHGSRGSMLASALLGKQTIAIVDYEHTSKVSVVKKLWVIHPEIIPLTQSPGDGRVMLAYPGIKEDVYLPSFRPDPQLRERLGVAQDELLVTVRPPATEAHYHNPEAEELLAATLKKFSNLERARVLLLPRSKNQERDLRAAWSKEIASGKILIPAHVEDGMNIIWNSDLVVSGGGTMNREAAAMGVPVYSIFRGPIGAVDRFLSSQGRLVLLENVEQVRTRIQPVRRDKQAPSLNHKKSPALETILNYIADIAQSKIRLDPEARK